MTDAEFLNEVKYRVGIYYTDEQVDKSITTMINGCKQYVENAGVKREQMDCDLMLDIAAMWVEATRNATLNDLIVGPAFISFVLQLKHYTPSITGAVIHETS
ncbi:hypothetical protein RBG61_01980 [Paludicola sp. MB14-C6]|uniref:phage head-tail connector protein n=1 Tax=Paludihabitans sp. MB14-C6 TaxID=3070656 RepID=UPI0027DCFA93|nr:hypothetical protein [Paludicola sp. MB14-C6]WMJ23460.1 hypothetical protein RBG61_01980 [Paludicola sp. MB14-C6]